MAWGRFTIGYALRPEEQREALARFVHRYTRENIPAWSKIANSPVQFASDAEWLGNTLFRTNKDGALHATASCNSYPTWPDNPELQERDGVGYAGRKSRYVRA